MPPSAAHTVPAPAKVVTRSPAVNVEDDVVAVGAAAAAAIVAGFAVDAAAFAAAAFFFLLLLFPIVYNRVCVKLAFFG